MINKKVLKYTSMRNETNLNKVRDSINKAKSKKPSKEIRELLFEIVNSNKEISLDQLQFKLIIDYNILMDCDVLHSLLFSHPIAIETEKEIRKLDLSCPKCSSKEKHYPLTLKDSIICFICGFEYKINKNN